MAEIKVPQLEYTFDKESLYPEQPMLYAELPKAETETPSERYTLNFPKSDESVSQRRTFRRRKCGGLSEY